MPVLQKKAVILVAPLDWGLGHATRCVPIIRQLIEADCRVLIAAEGKTKALLQAEFQQLTFLHLDGYRIVYGQGKWGFLYKVILQIPKIFRAIKREQKWLKQIVENYNVDAVISDNRYGLYHPVVISVFITHQLRIKSGFGSWSESVLQRINYSFINRFDECWIPDNAGKENLAGTLSHPEVKPAIPVRYIGPLTRFRFPGVFEKESNLLILLSGPEPHRTLLENLLLAQLKKYQHPVTVIRGLPGETITPDVPVHITIKNHLPATELEIAIVKAGLVISRCGYSTVMDLMELRKRSILVPTPGQTEQEYLADYLMDQQYALCIKQVDFNLTAALAAANHFSYKHFENTSAAELKNCIQNLVEEIKSKRES